MDALVQAFVIAALCEAGSRTGLLAAALSVRYRRAGAVLAGIAIAAAINVGAGAALGALLADAASHRAIRLLVGVSLLLAGGSALFAPKPPPAIERWRLGPLASSAGAFLILAAGDRGQFAIGAIAAASGAPALAGAGGALGVVAASIPPVLLGERWGTHPVQRPLRVVAGTLLILAGAVVALGALALL